MKSQIDKNNLYVLDHPLIREKLSMLRNEGIGAMKFRQILREVSIFLCYEATRDLNAERAEKPVKTPMGVEAEAWNVTDQVVLIPILRAGQGMITHILDLMPAVSIWPIGIRRKGRERIEYLPPENEGLRFYEPLKPEAKVCLILDPTLATGGSAIRIVDLLKEVKIRINRVKFVGLVAAPEGIKALDEKYPEVSIYVAAIDDRLDDDGFILPGIGDTGPRMFDTEEG